MRVPQIIATALGVAERRWLLPSGLPADETRRRIADRTTDRGGPWAPLQSHRTRSEQLWITARSVDAITDLGPRERFVLEVGDDGVTVVGRPGPMLFGLLAVLVPALLLTALGTAASGAAIGDEDLPAVALCALLFGGFMRVVLPRAVRTGDHRRLRGYLTSILDPDTPE